MGAQDGTSPDVPFHCGRAEHHCYEAKLRDTQVVMIVGERKLFKLKVPCGRDVAGAT
jgi:hypothetical protein